MSWAASFTLEDFFGTSPSANFRRHIARTNFRDFQLWVWLKGRPQRIVASNTRRVIKRSPQPTYEALCVADVGKPRQTAVRLHKTHGVFNRINMNRSMPRASRTPNESRYRPVQVDAGRYWKQTRASARCDRDA
jgi:hypothetical protein